MENYCAWLDENYADQSNITASSIFTWCFGMHKEQLTEARACLRVIGIPCNQFGSQEPGSPSEIQSFCQKNYGVEFEMMEKVSVKGKDMSEVYVWLNNKSSNGVADHSVRWNFHKFLIDEKGRLMASLKSGVKPLSKDITDFASGK